MCRSKVNTKKAVLKGGKDAKGSPRGTNERGALGNVTSGHWGDIARRTWIKKPFLPSGKVV